MLECNAPKSTITSSLWVQAVNHTITIYNFRLYRKVCQRLLTEFDRTCSMRSRLLQWLEKTTHLAGSAPSERCASAWTPFRICGLGTGTVRKHAQHCIMCAYQIQYLAVFAKVLLFCACAR